MRLLVLGNSSIYNRKVLPGLKQIKNLEIELASRRKIKNNLTHVKTYRSYNDAIKRTKAKIIYISLINSKHYFWAKKCLENKKHVIIDKPVTLNLKQLDTLLSLAKKKKLFISEAIVFHYHKQFKYVIKKIKFNKPTKIYTYFHIPKLNKKNFRNYSKLGGGCYQDMSAYAAYLIKLIFKNQKLVIKNKLHNFFRTNSNSFLFSAINLNIALKCSFSFNKTYKNYMKINTNNKEYKINFFFSPPIDQNLIISEKSKNSKKYKEIYFKSQNTFYTYFNMILKIIKKKKFDFFYDELRQTAKIKNEII